MAMLGIYIQVPFCQTKCTYCNFHTGVVSPGRFAPYATAVCREIVEHNTMLESAAVAPGEGKWAQNLSIDTVYIGGGTPSLLEPELLSRMLEALRAKFHCSLREVTLEADPETIDAKNAGEW